MLGNGRLEAQCIDGTKRLCHIRGKMRKKVRPRRRARASPGAAAPATRAGARLCGAAPLLRWLPLPRASKARPRLLPAPARPLLTPAPRPAARPRPAPRAPRPAPRAARQVWVNAGDIVLVGLRDYQDEKADVILK